MLRAIPTNPKQMKTPIKTSTIPISPFHEALMGSFSSLSKYRVEAISFFNSKIVLETLLLHASILALLITSSLSNSIPFQDTCGYWLLIGPAERTRLHGRRKLHQQFTIDRLMSRIAGNDCSWQLLHLDLPFAIHQTEIKEDRTWNLRAIYRCHPTNRGTLKIKAAAQPCLPRSQAASHES